jgi:hypothetical protein
MKDQDHDQNVAIALLNERVETLIELTEQNSKALNCIKTNATEINEVLTVWKHGKATFWTFWGLGKVTMFISAVVVAAALLIKHFEIGGK